MGKKENKTRPSMLTRSLSYAFGGSRHNAQYYPPPQPHYHGLPPGPPPCSYHAYGHGRHLSCSDFPRPHYYASSLRSTSATASDSIEAPSSTSNQTSNGSSGTSSHYSGFNSAVYAPQRAYSPVQTAIPHLHSLLDASSPGLVWDVRTKPKELRVIGSASHDISPNVLSFPLLANASDHIRIISPDFPWTIEIGPKYQGITSSEVLHALYDLLSSDLEDSTWTLASERKRASIVRAWKRRSDPGPRIRKVDWLGTHYMFKGLYRDATFKQRDQRPDTEDVPDTLLVALGRA